MWHLTSLVSKVLQIPLVRAPASLKGLAFGTYRSASGAFTKLPQLTTSGNKKLNLIAFIKTRQNKQEIEPCS